MAGSILPVYRWLITYDGAPAPGAKAYFYLSGTSTPQPVYSDAALNTQRTNPVEADADGILPICYLAGVAYRVEITTSTGTVIFPAQDGIYDLFEVFAATPETANTVYAGPTSGSAAAPTFRALVVADLPAGSVTQTTTEVGTQNDFALTARCAFLRCNNASALTLTGFATGLDGQMLVVSSVGAGSVTLSNETGSSAANQIITSLAADLVLNAGLGSVTMRYDGTSSRWRVVNYTAASTNLILQGVSFPAVQVPSSGANVLDDYEEGSWTPTIGSSGGGAATYSLQVGRYVKIGRTVFCWGRITMATKGTLGAGSALVSSLPFTSDATGSLHGMWLFPHFLNMTTSVILLNGYVGPATTHVVVLQTTAAATGVTNTTIADLSTTTDLIFGGWYLAAD